MNQHRLRTPRSPVARPIGERFALERLFGRISDLSTLAAGAQEIIHLAKRSSKSLEDLQKLIRTDPSLVALLLRRVNSSYYGLSTQVTDLKVAARLLGFREVRNLAITIYLSRMFDPPMEIGTFSTQGLWGHSVAVAAASHLVSRVCGCAVPADAYVAGLLHDIGLLLINRQMRRHFMQLVEQVQHLDPTLEVERELYLFNHAHLGAHVAAHWDFPGAIVDAIHYHHEVEHYAGVHRDLVYVVSVANYLCSRAGWTSLGVHNVTVPPDRTYRILGLDEMALSIIWEELTPTLEKAVFLAEV